MNPYYNPADFNLELISFDRPDMSYEFDTICFWKTTGGSVYSAQDSGCSCPTPFEDYDVSSLGELLPQLAYCERVEHALAEFDSWGYGSSEDRDRLIEWFGGAT